MKNVLVFILIVASLIGCTSKEEKEKAVTKEEPSKLQQTIYYGGDIITMEGDSPQYDEAVVERDGKIVYAGAKANAVNNFAGKTIEVDLKGKTIGVIGVRLAKLHFLNNLIEMV